MAGCRPICVELWPKYIIIHIIINIIINIFINIFIYIIINIFINIFINSLTYPPTLSEAVGVLESFVPPTEGSSSFGGPRSRHQWDNVYPECGGGARGVPGGYLGGTQGVPGGTRGGHLAWDTRNPPPARQPAN